MHIRIVLVCLIVVQLTCAVLFLCGFLSISSHGLRADLGGTADQQVLRGTDGVTSQLDRSLNKLVIVVIDALRADFILSNKYDSEFSFIKEQMEHGTAMKFVAKAQTPTVTMPRIKALTSGTVPSFSDVILNFGSHPTVKSNFVDQLKASYHRAVFYGDDTWLRMFPTAFERSEGVSSFYVNDFTEVDMNVTQRMDEELQRDDWDVLILHYLGLDHIGHLAGPASSLVAPKLREMNGVLAKIYRYLEKEAGKNLLIVLGDHGMTDGGSHGGSSDSEIDTGMVFFSLSFKNESTQSPPATINQIDLASTVTALMGLSIPSDSVGVYIAPVLRSVLSNDQLRIAVCEMASHLREKLRDDISIKSDGLLAIKDVFCDTKITVLDGDLDKAEAELRRISQKLMQLGASFDLRLMVFALVIGTIGLAVHVRLWLSFCLSKVKMTEMLGVGLLSFHAVSFGATSFIEEEHQMWYYWTPTLCCIHLASSWVKKWESSLKVVGILMIQRIAREWNRTGDKWAHLPDTGDWLRE